MHKDRSGLLLSASDVVNYLACAHLTQLDLTHLDTPLELGESDPTLELLARKGDAWERTFKERLQKLHGVVVDVPQNLGGREAFEATAQAMREGAPIIYQAILSAPGYVGRTDFLRRIPLKTRFGDYGYEVLDTKLTKHPRAGHVLQLCFYAWLLSRLQEADPPYMHVVLGDGTELAFRYADYSRYFHRIRSRLERATIDRPADTYPDPCDKCAQCRWQTRCEEQRRIDDHLWEVAGITRSQILKLTDAGITTMAALAAIPEAQSVPRLSRETFLRVRSQAAMQVRGRMLGKTTYELRAAEPDRGFGRLPEPCEGDIYFDMEGDPLFDDDGLEYLFGVSFRDNGTLLFKAFWGHDRAGERRAFEGFIDFVVDRQKAWPALHIYHYADYERSALENLMSAHGTREAEVDALFRDRRLVDLYRVVREGVLASTNSYSIKDIETLYRGKRTGEVINAGASIVQYERWRETGDEKLLQDIERYNLDDCESTAQLHTWLIERKPHEVAWRPGGRLTPTNAAPKKDDGKSNARGEERERARQSKEVLKSRLLSGLPSEPEKWSASEQARYLTAYLLDFHRRCEKPIWWKLFACRDLSEEELRDHSECIGGLTRVRIDPAVRPARLPTWTYEYPEQEFKASENSDATRLDVLANVTLLKIDEGARHITMRPSAKALPDPDSFSLGPPGPISTEALQNAIFRYAAAAADPENPYRALEAFLSKAPPKLLDRVSGGPLCPSASPQVTDVVEAVAALDESHLFIQGPPGAGKTYTGSHVILELLRRGKRVAISSNSHKAITNLLSAIEGVAAATGFRFKGLQKTEDSNDNGLWQCVERTNDNETIEKSDASLVAGTAWLFARPALDRRFDYLFVDEAGQVSLGNLVAMGVAAKNLVLLGDQMQLGQPIQGSHPGHSGDSALEYLLDGQAVIAPERGIFLGSTFRMHPDVCRFISDAVYDGQLQSASRCESQRLLLGADAHPALASTGIRFLPVQHDGNAQRSEEEAEIVVQLYRNLLTQRWRNHVDKESLLTHDDVLVVAPYNMQVNLLRRLLPEGARVGTVDKFQGQEASVVLVSLATSSGEYLPRDIEFLFSKNRINVALSRAKCLAVLIGSPKLLDVTCRTAEEMSLVNLLCWVEEYARNSRAACLAELQNVKTPAGSDLDRSTRFFN